MALTSKEPEPERRKRSVRQSEWLAYLAEGPIASDTFMDNVEDLPPRPVMPECEHEEE